MVETHDEDEIDEDIEVQEALKSRSIKKNRSKDDMLEIPLLKEQIIVHPPLLNTNTPVNIDPSVLQTPELKRKEL